MTKAELINKVHEAVDLDAENSGIKKISKQEIEKTLSTAFDIIDSEVSSGTTVCYNNRRFKLITRKARNGFNPRTKQSISIPERKYISYRKRLD